MAPRKQAKSQPPDDAPETNQETDGDEKITFEDAMAEVEAIVSEMEDEEVPLDQLLVRYERGTRLIQFCKERLDHAQARVEMIAAGKGGDGGPRLVPFDDEPDAADSPRSGEGSLPSPKEDEDSKKPNDDIRLF